MNAGKRRSVARRLLWFGALWVLGVLAVGVAAYAIRLLLGA